MAVAWLGRQGLEGVGPRVGKLLRWQHWQASLCGGKSLRWQASLCSASEPPKQTCHRRGLPPRRDSSGPGSAAPSPLSRSLRPVAAARSVKAVPPAAEEGLVGSRVRGASSVASLGASSARWQVSRRRLRRRQAGFREHSAGRRRRVRDSSRQGFGGAAAFRRLRPVTGFFRGAALEPCLRSGVVQGEGFSLAGGPYAIPNRGRRAGVRFPDPPDRPADGPPGGGRACGDGRGADHGCDISGHASLSPPLSLSL